MRSVVERACLSAMVPFEPTLMLTVSVFGKTTIEYGFH